MPGAWVHVRSSPGELHVVERIRLPEDGGLSGVEEGVGLLVVAESVELFCDAKSFGVVELILEGHDELISLGSSDGATLVLCASVTPPPLPPNHLHTLAQL